ncbi:hypothetical protein AC249_AIPGENE8522, partial [Exaiptasia diaphana]
IIMDSLTQFPDDIRTSSKVAPKYVTIKPPMATQLED